MKQTRTLYETSFFFSLLIISKGWMLIRNHITRKEFKYLIIYMLIVYLLDSIVNIIDLISTYFSLILYFSLAGHCGWYSRSTLKGLEGQL